MDVQAIASAAIAILTPYLAKAGEEIAKKAVGAAWEKAREIYQAVQARIAKEKEPYPQQTLGQFQENPEKRQGAMQDVLIEILEKDPAFAERLQCLLKEAQQAGAGTTFNTNVFGGQVGEIINIDKVEKGLTIKKE